ncbi:hypothetical protein GZH82_00185 [Staphylococcus ursi]|uniref:nucleotidyltransferase domain-containing protein n=1 Tax=Staphylococcus sp. MI 10-1553 TaxID=1912064 RepID=UPI001398E5DB|nr:nucleotidyltransferase domain-containing protein [Staphylococcus sp. MI 10-1553]QHW35911.1 hypothetical protein GZH82_00185 [Staphylococcus sp. MI 10-1553]
MNSDLLVKETKEFFECYNDIEFLNNENVSTVFISGSLLEGFGNENSDIDIFVILKNSHFLKEFINRVKKNELINIIERRNKTIITATYEERNFDIEILESGYITEYIQQVNVLNAYAADERYDLLHRMKYGKVIYNEENFYKIFESINQNKFRRIHTQTLNTYYAVKMHDIHGAFKEKEFVTGYFMGIDLLNLCIDAYLSIRGETNPSSKWRLKKINRYDMNKKHNDLDIKDFIYDVYKGLDLRNDLIMKKKLKNVITLCQKINTEIEVHNYDL